MSKDRVVSVRFTETEHANLTAQAEKLGITLSELLRRSVLRPVAPPPMNGIQTPPTWASGAPSTSSILWDTGMSEPNWPGRD